MNIRKGFSKPTKRDETFAESLSTRICREVSERNNPFSAESVSYYGYDIKDILRNCSYIESLFLLFRGELPSPEQSELLEKLMIALINPGPRHPATRAAMYASVSKTGSGNVLPIGLAILSGSHNGAFVVEQSMRFLRKHYRKNPVDVAESLISKLTKVSLEDISIAPGFGQSYQTIDPVCVDMAAVILQQKGAGQVLIWAGEFCDAIKKYQLGWLKTGLAASVFCDLGFQPRTGTGFYQLLSAPGILAHGLEFANKKLTDLPFPGDEDYEFE